MRNTQTHTHTQTQQEYFRAMKNLDYVTFNKRFV